MRNLSDGSPNGDGSNSLGLGTANRPTEQPESLTIQVLCHLERCPRVGQSRHGHTDALWLCPEVHLLSYAS
jgi:hypothetical protein